MATATNAGTLSVTRLSGSLGAEIRGVKLVEATPDDVETFRKLLLEHLVIFFSKLNWPQAVTHTPLTDHFAGNLGGTFNIISGASGFVVITKN